jgi:hypothetical protein
LKIRHGRQVEGDDMGDKEGKRTRKIFLEK